MQRKAKTIWRKMTDAANKKPASTAILKIDLKERFIVQRSMQDLMVY